MARRDWRWWVGGIGRVLIATGLLLFAFVGYQLWGTGIEEAQSQNRLENEFDDLLGSTTVPTTSPGQTTTVPAVTPTTADGAPGEVQVLPPIADGDPIAALSMPSIGVDKYVVAGIDTDDLKKGPGHFPSTPLPGQYGNAAIAGHRTTYGAPFYDIDELAVGDPIVVTTLFGTYTYVVTEQLIVAPSDYGLVVDGDPTKVTLTLVSCHPRYTARERIVVRAELDAAASDEPGRPVLNYGRDEPAPEPTLPGEELPDETDPSEVTQATGGGPTATTVAGATEPGGDATDASAEAFAQGWFDDPDAWPQVALWGLALIAIALAATWLSRRVHRNWVGALVGIVPFVLVLYFFFQNVNRLLPPNL